MIREISHGVNILGQEYLYKKKETNFKFTWKYKILKKILKKFREKKKSWRVFRMIRITLTHCGRVTQICVFNTVKLGTSASSP